MIRVTHASIDAWLLLITTRSVDAWRQGSSAPADLWHVLPARAALIQLAKDKHQYDASQLVLRPPLYEIPVWDAAVVLAAALRRPKWWQVS